MEHHRVGKLRIGDRVSFSGSSVDAIGVVVAEVDGDYVRVRWDDSTVSTTHRRHALYPVTNRSRLVFWKSTTFGTGP